MPCACYHGHSVYSQRVCLLAGTAGGAAQLFNGVLTKPYPPYEAFGLRNGNDHRQCGSGRSRAKRRIQNSAVPNIGPKANIR